MLKGKSIISAQHIFSLLLFLSPIIIAISALAIVPLAALFFLYFVINNYRDINFKEIYKEKYIFLLLGVAIIFSIFGEFSVKPLKAITQLIAILICGVLLTRINIAANFRCFSLGYIVAISLLFLLEITNAYPIIYFFPEFSVSEFLILKINRALCIFALFAPIICNYLWRNNDNKSAIFCYILIATTIAISASATAKLTFITVSLVWLASYKLKPVIINLLLMSYLLGNIGAGILVLKLDKQNLAENSTLQFSFLHRTCIWEYTLKNVEIFGKGFNSSENKIFASEHDKEKCIRKSEQYKGKEIAYHISHHPHYNILQILFELGIAGLALFVYLLIYCKNKILAISDRSQRAIYNALFYGYLAIGTTGYEIWQSWYLISLFLMIFFTKLSLKPNAES